MAGEHAAVHGLSANENFPHDEILASNTDRSARLRIDSESSSKGLTEYSFGGAATSPTAPDVLLLGRVDLGVPREGHQPVRARDDCAQHRLRLVLGPPH